MSLVDLTSDPVISLELVKAKADVTDNDSATLIVNAVSRKFLRFMNRLVFASASVTESVLGRGESVIFPHAGPLTTDGSNDFTVEFIESGEAVETYLWSDSQVIVADDGSNDGIPVIFLADTITPASLAVPNVRLTYTGGWASGEIPGDIISAAIEQARIEARRQSGRSGITNSSRQEQSASFETAGLVESVRDALEPYRINI